MGMSKHEKPIEYKKDGAIMQVLRMPQLMHARFSGFSTFFKNRQRNERINDEWNKQHPRLGRPI